MVTAFGFQSHGGPEVGEFLDLERPTPLPGELLVEVRAAGVNPVDWKIRAGLFAEPGSGTFPAVLGNEVSGVVREVGGDVEGFKIGDEVFGSVAPGSGGYTQWTLLTATATAKKPVQVSFTDAATLSIAAATGYDGVTQLELVEGQTLLINGASGGVGVAAAQIARDRGIAVVGIAGPDKQALVESLGAIFVPYGDGVADRVSAILPSVDAIFDLAGGDGLRAVAPLLADRTKLITAGDPDTAADLGGRDMTRDGSSQVLDILAGMVADGKLDPKVEDVVPLDKAAEALAAVEVGHAKGKVVIGVS